ncbi:MAG: transposase [Thermoleophilia bacterium]|nr:transposase [Thermoleophilia bacterium]
MGLGSSQLDVPGTSHSPPAGPHEAPEHKFPHRDSRPLRQPRRDNRNDHKLLRQTIDSIPIARPQPTGESPQGLCLGKGYDYPEVREIASELDLTLHLRTRGEKIEAKRSDPDFIARRWVVERSHSWLNRNRGLLIRWSKKPENHRCKNQPRCSG